MNALEGITNPHWLVLALAFLAVMFYLVYMRQRETRRILSRFERGQIVITSFGVNYYGLDSEPGGPLRSSGALVLVKSGLYYRARFAKRELFIPGPSITYIGVSNQHKGKDLHQSAVVIQFLDEEGRESRAAFRIPFPAQWVGAIKAHLIGDRPLRGPSSDREPRGDRDPERGD